MNVLDSLIEGVREDLEARRIPMAKIVAQAAQAEPVRSPLLALTGSQMKVIGEVKRSSPSKGALAQIADPAALAISYEKAGVSVISVLTETRKFGGSLADLDEVRTAVSIPILRKDFMVDEYQFFEARAHGADLVLLIVAALDSAQLLDFYQLAQGLGMQALVEVHSEDELERALDISPSIVGVNSRNLKTLDVDSAVFASLIPRIPSEIVKVAESGIAGRKDVIFAQESGANAILVGETLVKGNDVSLTMRTLLGLE